MMKIADLFHSRVGRGNKQSLRSLSVTVSCPRCGQNFQWKDAVRTSREISYGLDAIFHQNMVNCPHCDAVALYSMPDIDGWEWEDSFRLANPACELPPHYVYMWGSIR